MPAVEAGLDEKEYSEEETDEEVRNMESKRSLKKLNCILVLKLVSKCNLTAWC